MKSSPINRILSIDFSKVKKWSKRNKRCGGYYKCVSNIRKILDLISGSDTIDMLKDIIKESEKKQLNSDVYTALSNMNQLFIDSKPKMRHTIIRPLKKAQISYRKIKKMGFKASHSLWKNCLSENIRNSGGKKNILRFG